MSLIKTSPGGMVRSKPSPRSTCARLPSAILSETGLSSPVQMFVATLPVITMETCVSEVEV